MARIVNQTLFRKTLYRTLIVPLVLLATLPAALSYFGQGLVTATASESRSIDTISAVHETEKLILDSETGLRGYQLTGNLSFLEPYQWAESSLPSRWEHLRQLVASNPEQLQLLDRTQRAYSNWKNFAIHAIETRRLGGTGTTEFNIQGRALMDETRQGFLQFNSNEQKLLAQHSTAVASRREFVHLFRYIAAGLIFLITGIWAWRQLRFLARNYEESIEELNEQKEWFRVTLTSIGDAVIVTNRDGKVVFINPEAERLSGWEWKDAKDKSLRAVFRIINEQTRHPADDPVEKVFREHRVVGLANHTLLIAKNGTEWPIEDSASPIYGKNGEIMGVVLVFHDATEIRRAEKLLKNYSSDLEKKVLERTIELHRTINDLQAFSYSVSHDLRSPLRAMQAYTQVLQEDYGDKLDDTGRDYLSRVANSAKRLDALIQDILTYSRLGSEQQAIQPVNLNQLITDIVEQYPSLKEASSQIEVRRPLAPVMGHEPGLTQVISNLLGNALKFAPPDRAARVILSTEVKENTVVISVSDNGIGIRPEDQARIFKMFEQVDGKKYAGTGIGLAIVKRAVEQMHGTVGVESTLGEGSRFWIELLKPRPT
ncbi:MAG TPA: ATP-binding protein [Opitutaceae bacterium]